MPAVLQVVTVESCGFLEKAKRFSGITKYRKDKVISKQVPENKETDMKWENSL